MIAPFRPRLPWLGGDLQTLRNQLVRPRLALPDGERIWLGLGDGDALAAMLHRPERSGKPLVVAIHGLSGSEQSSYVRASAAHLLSRDYPVLRLNLRGAGPSRPLCRRQYHAGRSEDLRLALAALPPDLSRHGLALIGYSLGGNVLLKFMAEEPPPEVLAAAAVSAPIDLAAASARLLAPRNRIYQSWLLAKMREEALEGFVSEEERRALLSARTVFEFDDRYVAPRNGFASASDYYARSSAAPLLARIAAPTLLIHAANDPWIPIEAYRQAERLGHPALHFLFADGGHVGFHDRTSDVPWHDRAIAAFLEDIPALTAS
jgi:predicted alpha/beta-fold hydrolase